MIREFSIEIYLLLFKLQYLFFKCFPVKNKIVFCVSFTENPRYIVEEILRENVKTRLVFLCRGTCISSFRPYGRNTIQFETLNPLAMFRSVYHIATARTIIVDNYYAFLSVIRLRKNVQCIQIWHAAGAMKTFGLEDRSVSKRTPHARNRFIKVYQHFDKVVVGSESMAEIFMRSFGLPHERMLPTGIPRTDLFFNNKKILEIRSIFRKKFGNKKIILYAPTFRDGESGYHLNINLKLMKAKLKDQYVVMLRLHPLVHMEQEINDEIRGFVFDYSFWPDINELLIASDILITDYSSVPFEYALLDRPIIFYLYDLDDYKKKRGLQRGFQDWLPGPVARTTDQVVDLINHDSFDIKQIADFAKKWNTYSDGHASYKLVQYIEQGRVTQTNKYGAYK
jgi:CDP-glycerol glycerophosphotransferase (TagB/SpsB family)